MPKVLETSGIVAKTQAQETIKPFISSRSIGFLQSFPEFIGLLIKIIAITAINESVKLISKSIVGLRASMQNAAVKIEFSWLYRLRVRCEIWSVENIIAARIALVGYPHSAT